MSTCQGSKSLPLSSYESLLARLARNQNLSLIVSICRDCVLGCRYCYAIDPENLPPKRILSDAILEKIIKDAFEVRQKHVSFEWTGGEALLAGKGFFAKVRDLQKKYQKPDKTFDNCIQTSGGIYNEGLYDFLLKNGFSLGITIDGPRDLHEAQRPTKGGHSSFDVVLKSYEYIKKKQGRCGVLCTVTNLSLGRQGEIFDFYKSLGIKHFHSNPYVFDPNKPVQSEELGLKPQAYAHYFKQQFDHYLQLDDLSLMPSYINYIMKAVSGISSGSKCTHSGVCLTNFMNIDDLGNAAICPKFLGYEEMRLGNILDHSMADLLSPDNLVMKKFLEQRVRAVNSCETDGCEYTSVCNSGCPYDSFLVKNDGSIEHRDYLCPGKHEIYEHIDTTLQKYGMTTITSCYDKSR
jgi:uncharacterized protein